MVDSTLTLKDPHGPLDRALYSLFVPEPSRIPSLIGYDSSHFACFIAWDARDVEASTIATMSRGLIERGIAYLCSWGPGCERVHDIFDGVEIEMGAARPKDSVVMTTWHHDEPLAEALWFFVFSSYPDAAYEDSCKRGIALSIGNEDWGKGIAAYLSDLNSLNVAVGL